jgi:general secretion pathway protein D
LTSDLHSGTLPFKTFPSFCMIPRFARLCLAVPILVLALDIHAQAPTPLPQNPPAAEGARPIPPVVTPIPPAGDDEPVQLKLPDADIDTVLSTLETFTGRIILRPAQLGPTTTFNLKITKPTPKSEVILYIETILAMNNIAVVPLGDHALEVWPLNLARVTAPEFINGSTLDLAPSGKVAAKLFQLEFLRVQEFAQMLTGMINPLYGQPVQFPSANAVLVTDSVANLQRVETLLQKLDRPITAGMKPKFYTLHNAKAGDVVTKLRAIFQGALQAQIGTGTSFSADDRTSQIILVTDPRQFDLFDELIEKLDARGDSNTRNDVIPLKHADAQAVATVLTGIVNGQATAAQKANSGQLRPGQAFTNPMNQAQNGAPNQPGNAPIAPSPVNIPGLDSVLGTGSNEFSTLVTIIPDTRGNAIVVSGTIDDIRLLTQLIDKLDTILAQVRIEVVIAEVTLDDNHTSGISQLGLKIDGDRLVGFVGGIPGLSVSGTGASGTGAGTDFASISRIGGPGSLGRSLDLAGIISLGTTPRKNDTSVLSVPSITTTHAKEATFISSEQRPIVNGTVSTPTAATSTGGLSTSSNYTLQDIGITLTVKPLIGNDGSVQLDIMQDVKDVAGFTQIDQNQVPIISHRSAKSFITAHSGEIIVLGGMQRKKTSWQTNRLGPIPFIGDLLGSRTKGDTRTELIFFMRPYVLTNVAAIDNASAIKRVDELPQKEDIRKELDPNYVPPKKSLIQKILPKG